MRRSVLNGVILGAAGMITAAAIGFAQTPANAPNAPVPPRPAYRPGLGDLMVGSIQPRHIKLAIAGSEKNWDYLAYELHELQESFDRVAQNFPQSGGMPLADMLAASTKGPMEELAASITAKDAAKFKTAFADLTDSCNTCHQAMKRGMVVIKVPDTASFPDQDFAPGNP